MEKLKLKYLITYKAYCRIKIIALQDMYNGDFLMAKKDDIIGIEAIDYSSQRIRACNKSKERPMVFDIVFSNETGLIEEGWGLLVRPLSDLIKEIEHNGEKFIPLGKLHYRYCLTTSGKRTTKAKYEYIEDREIIGTWYGGGLYGSYGIRIDKNNLVNSPHKIYQWLIRWQFDVFGLYENNLAININTLKT